MRVEGNRHELMASGVNCEKCLNVKGEIQNRGKTRRRRGFGKITAGVLGDFSD